MTDKPIAVVLGTRPEIVKLAPLIGALDRPTTVIHTGQHYDTLMSDVFFDAFSLPAPDHTIGVGGASRAVQIGRVVAELDPIFEREEPAAVVVQGDTNSTMAAAIAANSRSIPIVHVEAGLRSNDRNMPEEHNRVVTDHLADLCLAPTEVSAANLEAEGISPERIVITGNTVVDAVRQILPAPDEVDRILDRHGLRREGYVISTFHRPENVDDPHKLETILSELARIELPVFLPLHPRTRARAREAGVEIDTERVTVVDPIDYVEFLALLSASAMAVADSGGLQEEVSIVKRPMVVVRSSTERPEVLGTFCSLEQVGPTISKVSNAWLSGDPHTLEELAAFPSPYGDGDASERSRGAIERLLA